MTPKAGWQTTEFWITIGMTLLPFLASFGAIQSNEVAGLQDKWTTLAQSLGAAVAAGMYIYSRARIKAPQVVVEPQIPQIPQIPQVPQVGTVVKGR